MCLIYKITNICNNKIYIGKLSRKRDFNSYWGSGVLLKRSIKKYGIEQFKKEIIEEVSKEEVNKRERYWIKKLRANDIRIGYNLTLGGDGGDVFTHKSNDMKSTTRKRISKAHKGIKQNKEWVKKRTSKTTGSGNGMYGKKLSMETLKKISQKLKGKKKPESHRIKCRNRMLGKNNSFYKVLNDPVKYEKFLQKLSIANRGGNNSNAKKIRRCDLSGKFIESYPCMKDAAFAVTGKYCGSVATVIRKAAQNKKIAYNFLWEII